MLGSLHHDGDKSCVVGVEFAWPTSWCDAPNTGLQVTKNGGSTGQGAKEAEPVEVWDEIGGPSRLHINKIDNEVEESSFK